MAVAVWARPIEERRVKAEELYNVAGKVVVVTGGANGLGFGMARAMSDNGARWWSIVDRDRADAEQAVAELSARSDPGDPPANPASQSSFATDSEPKRTNLAGVNSSAFGPSRRLRRRKVTSED
jgi:NAD(P)-dependent dehydrogenase (short-subunit alcohol dehydrogenase family)